VLKADLDTYDPSVKVATIREEILNDTGSDVPTDPLEQLRGAICAVFDSWDSSRARAYRRHWGIENVGGTAVTVQAMVFGNLGYLSGTGVLFTRNPLTGEPLHYGEWLPGGQGDDVVGGTHAVQDINTLQMAMPAVHAELMDWAGTLECEHREVQDIEFTVQEGELYLLQTRTAKRAPLASLRIAVDLVDDGIITPEEAIMRVTPDQIRMVLLPRLDPTHVQQHIVASGEPACPGVAVGIGVVDPDEAERRSAAGESIVLVRPTTSPNDVHGMIAAVAVVTELGGSTSHAAVVTRALGRPSVVGVGDGVARGLEGKVLTVDGESGHVYEGEMPLVASRVADDPRLVKIRTWVDEQCPITVVHNSSDIELEVFDLDKAGFGMGHEGDKLDEQELMDALTGVTAVQGSVIGTALGMKIVLGSEVTHIVANPALPIKMLAVHVERGL
jgi:pyruvate,orthophosphate dikinase